MQFNTTALYKHRACIHTVSACQLRQLDAMPPIIRVQIFGNAVTIRPVTVKIADRIFVRQPEKISAIYLTGHIFSEEHSLIFCAVSSSKSTIFSCFKLIQSPVPTFTQFQLSTVDHLKRFSKIEF